MGRSKQTSIHHIQMKILTTEILRQKNFLNLGLKLINLMEGFKEKVVRKAPPVMFLVLFTKRRKIFNVTLKKFVVKIES